ncbi:MAG: DNA replication/repair protein RecF [Acidobacteria bacterium]|nr:DNA replication/repair protein RecF [Acidobacteriota bacterium]
MILRGITTDNFRNLEPASVEFHPKTNLIVGRNGQGKTNLLEAIYLLATTKSFRTPRTQTVFHFGDNTLFVSGTIRRDHVDRTLSVGLETGENRRRVLMVNGERVPLHEYLRAMTVFAYSSARLEILRGVPEERRRFIDRGVASIEASFLPAITRFSRTLKQRNAQLQSGSAQGLAAWDEEFVERSNGIQEDRAAYVDTLRTAFNEIVAKFDVRPVEMTYKPSKPDPSRRSEELRAGTTLTGPQRDNLEFTVDGRPAHEVLSGGELKLTVLLLKYAKLALFHHREEDDALFVLDDIDAELDVEILRKLLTSLPPQTQVFATSAKDRLISELATGSHRRLTVENGRVTGTEDFG